MQATMQQRKPEAPQPQPEQAAPSSTWRKVALRPEEGWATFILLGLVIYSAIWSIQVVNWVNGLGVLTWTTGLGLVFGLIAAKQHYIPRLVLHTGMMALGILFAFWQTANAASIEGGIGSLWDHFTAWLGKAVTPNANTNDDVMFLLFLAVLSFILAYVSVWLVFRTRRPWLVTLATAIVLLINLSYVDGNLIYLTIFLLAGLLLLVRFNLSEAYRQWRRRSLRYTADLGWDFMVAGMLFSVGILVFGWLLPAGGQNPAVAGIWSSVSNPWVAAQQLWSRLFQVQGGPGSGAYFSNRLQLTGNVDLPNYTILTYTSQTSGQYLIAVTQDYFDGHSWTQTGDTTRGFAANQDLAVNKAAYTVVDQQIHVVTPPGGSPNPYIFAAADPASFSVPIGATLDSSGFTSWYPRDSLVAGENYTATSFVTGASEAALRQVPLPADAQGTPYDYPSDLVARYTQVPGDLQSNQAVQNLISNWTKGDTTMYDMAQSIENHLRSEYHYNQHNDDPPAEQDAVAWFLLQSKTGFCTFFASAMVMAARMLGMPARVASGYTAGTYDTNTHQYVVKGTDAHTWPQIYFAKYGWINFEPSATFSPVARPIATATATGSDTPNPGNSPIARRTPNDGGQTPPTNGSGPTTSAQQNDLATRWLLGASIPLALLVLLLGATSLWWRRLFRGLSPVAQTFGRVTLLAGWAGVKPKRTQTPFEYIQALQQRLPAQAEPLQRLGELYVQERWGAPNAGAGIREEMRQIWAHLRGTLVRAVAHRPSLNPLVWVRALRSRRSREVR